MGFLQRCRCTRFIPTFLIAAALVTVLCFFPQIGQILTISSSSNCCFFGRSPLRWHAKKFWHDAQNFPACTMDACFDFSRCATLTSFRMYVYGAPFYPISYFNALFDASDAQLSSWVTQNASQACVFLLMEPVNYSILPLRPHPSMLQHWNGGLNHIIVSLADKWLETAPPGQSIGKAAVMASCLQQTEYRPEFDVSIPLPGKTHLPYLQRLTPWERRYFLTFKGTRYVGNKEGNFRSDPALRGMHNGKDIIMAMTCRHITNDKIIRQDPTEGKGCEEDELTYGRYDFHDLMNTTFGLTPAGRSPASYRLVEILSAGAIPVLLADNYVKPFESMIRWHRCLLQFPTSEIARIVSALRAMTKAEMKRRQRYCVFVYKAFLKDDATLVKSVVHSLQLRMYGVLPQLNDDGLIPDLLPQMPP